jgi:CYTH domain
MIWLHPTSSLLHLHNYPVTNLVGRKKTTTIASAVMKTIEVETKFRINTDGNTEDEYVKDRLRQLGFVPSRKIRFVDHYYDQDGTLSLSLRDTWLRFRAVAADDGQWQLKRGNKNRSAATTTDESLSSSSATVYEEIEGEDAIYEALNMLEDIPKSGNADNSGSFVNIRADGEQQPDYFIHPPQLPTTNTKGITPFCSLETLRESFEWSCKGNASGETIENDHDFVGMHVDLDQTNLGYAVGEVEKCVHTESEVEKANNDIATLLDRILEGKPRQDPPRGKLEHYLKTNRPEHYEALIRQGVIQKKDND